MIRSIHSRSPMLTSSSRELRPRDVAIAVTGLKRRSGGEVPMEPEPFATLVDYVCIALMCITVQSLT